MTPAQKTPAAWVIPSEGGRNVWVFALDLGEDAAASLARDPAALAAALGVSTLDTAHLELLIGEDFKDFGFTRYLAEGHGIAPASLSADTLTLDALRGPILLVYRMAFAPEGGQIQPQAPLRLIGRYDEPAPAPHIAMPEVTAAHGEVDAVVKRKPSDAAMSGRVASLVLGFLVVFVIVFVWIAT